MDFSTGTLTRGTNRTANAQAMGLPERQSSPAERVPVLLGQVCLHVEEGILPLLDLGADLLDESKLFGTRSGLAPARTQK